MKLLLVDDDIALRTQIKFALSQMFEYIYEAGCKKEAKAILDTQKIDIALLDLSLEADLDGVDIAVYSIQHNIKTLIFTANKSNDIVKKLIKEGVFDYINKPIDIHHLISSLDRAILFVTNEQKLADENIYHITCTLDAKDGIKNSLCSVEKDLLVKILKQNDFNIYKTAKLLNTKRENIYYFIKKYDIARYA